MPNLTLFAPVRGWCASLDEVPDAVFAQRLMGDGVAIDPTGDTLFAPCDGTVTSVASAHHAVVIRADNGAEILLHVGIDTVGLGGAGFRPAVATGARVRAGDPLLHFDLDALALAARSLVTPIVVTNGDCFTVAAAHPDRAVEVGDVLLELEPLAGTAALDGAGTTAPAEAGNANGRAASERLVVPFEHGIHARPAALIARVARTLAAEVTVAVRGRRASARSPVALMSLGARRGDELSLSATGAEAAAAVRELKRQILELGDRQEPWERQEPRERSPDREPAEAFAIRRSLPQATASLPQATASPPPAEGSRCLRGVIASRGFAVGRAVTLARTDVAVPEAGRGVAHERAALDHARAAVATRLDGLARSAGATAREVLAAHLELLDDPELTAAARHAISEGKSAAFAWRQAVRGSVETLRGLGDAHLAERVDDLLDLEAQVLLALHGEAPAAVGDLPEGAILIAGDLTPSQLVALDCARLAGLCTAAGGATSHVAIIAGAMGVPALAALGPGLLDVDDGAWLVLDAERGELDIAPDQDALAAAQRRLSARRQRDRAERTAARREGRTADGTRVEVFANLASVAEARLAVEHGAEGCGLLRSELLFLDREQPPDEDEQARHYQCIAEALGDRPLVIRTLDIGGDKPIPYLPLPPEANPALGLRGVRTSLWRPDLLRVQLRAILRVTPPERCRVLLPMVTDVTDVRSVRRLLDEVGHELGQRGRVPLGAMIETPASALAAGRIATEVDFLSIGTNDLTQYTLAMDRDHAELAQRSDALHPAVLRLIAMTVSEAARHGRPVCVCGGLASDLDAVPVLLGLGIVELSVVAALVPQVKARLCSVTLDACRDLAERALALDTAAAVRAMLAEDSTPAEHKVAT